MRSKSVFPLVMGFLLGIAVAVVVVMRPAAVLDWIPGSGNVESEAPVLGAMAPDFQLENLAGDLVRLKSLHGRPVMINFWATWCGPCRLEMPLIQSRYDRFRPDLKVLAVNLAEPRDVVQDFSDELGLTIDILLDLDGEVSENLYRVRGYPSTYFVDKDGIIQVIHIGIMTDGQLDDYLEKIGISQ